MINPYIGGYAMLYIGNGWRQVYWNTLSGAAGLVCAFHHVRVFFDGGEAFISLCTLGGIGGVYLKVNVYDYFFLFGES